MSEPEGTSPGLSESQKSWTPVLAGKKSSDRQIRTSRQMKTGAVSSSTDDVARLRVSAPDQPVPPPSFSKPSGSPPSSSSLGGSRSHLAMQQLAASPSAGRGHRRSRSAGSMKALTGMVASSPPQDSNSSRQLPKLSKQKSSLNKFFTLGRTSQKGAGADGDSGLLSRGMAEAELSLSISLAGQQGRQKSTVLKVQGRTLVREVLETFQSKAASRLKKWSVENPPGMEGLGLSVVPESREPIWLQPTAPIGCYCEPDGTVPSVLTVGYTPPGGVSKKVVVVKLMQDEQVARLVVLDLQSPVSVAMAQCAELSSSGDDTETLHLWSRSHEKGLWLDPEAPVHVYGLTEGAEVELREPNFVVLVSLQGTRYLLDGSSTGESFLRRQVQALGLPTEGGLYYSLFREVEPEMVELSTWQTISNMGLAERQIVHLCKMADSDEAPESQASFFVETVSLLRPRASALLMDSSSSLPAPLQDDTRDWHTLLKLYHFEDILGRVEGVHLQTEEGTGILAITNAALVFKSDKTFVRAFHGMIQKVEKVAARQKKKSKGSAIDSNISLLVDCKDFETYTFGLPKQVPKNFLESFVMLAFPKVSSQLPAFSYKLPPSVTPDPNLPDGWDFYDAHRYHERMGVGVEGTPGADWVVSDINDSYGLCSTYPSLLVVPIKCSHDALRSSASFRSRGRLPALSYLHRNGASISRCSQPLVGLIGGSSGGDAVLLQAILEANPNKEGAVLRLIDARPKLNAIANQAMGKGSERTFHYVFECSLEFANIDNIHVMRQSLVKLHEACRASRAGEVDWNTYNGLLSSSGWLGHVYRVLAASLKVARYVGLEKHSVVLHCSDGWDRTAQLSSLSMLLLNPHYRTLRGFCEMIEKEWLAFGHQFARRHGHADGKMDQEGDSQRSPVFLQFLDCAWQLLNLHPCSFEFNGFFLSTIMEEVYNCRFGTFLYDFERERAANARHKTVSLWTYILSPSVIDLYRNPLYTKSNSDTILADIYPHSVQLWSEFFLKSSREDFDRIREMSMRIEMLEAQVAAYKKRAAP